MYFTSVDGSSFALKILSYQFPHLEREDYDSNWLNVRIDVITQDYSWSATEPSLLTYEVARLAEWLDAVKQGESVEDEIGFIEPCLWFKLTNDNGTAKSLQIHFELEYRPDQSRMEKMRERLCFVEFSLAEIDLEQASASLRSQLSNYPQRAER